MIYVTCQSDSFHILTQANLGAVDLIQTQPTLKQAQINPSISVWYPYIVALISTSEPSLILQTKSSAWIHQIRLNFHCCVTGRHQQTPQPSWREEAARHFPPLSHCLLPLIESVLLLCLTGSDSAVRCNLPSISHLLHTCVSALSCVCELSSVPAL